MAFAQGKGKQPKRADGHNGSSDTAMDIETTEDDNHKDDSSYTAAITGMAQYFQQALSTELRRAISLVAERQVTLNETIIQQKLRLLEEKVCCLHILLCRFFFVYSLLM